MNRILRGAAAGALGGMVATSLMSAVMLAARWLGITPELPPVRIAEEAIERTADRPARDAEEGAVATVAHFGFGATAGLVFGAAATVLRAIPAPALAVIGAIYATGVWFVSYQGWVPGLGIMPPASRDHPGRVTTMVVAHWVFGAVLGAATSALRGRFNPRR